MATKILVWALVVSVLLASLPIPLAVISHSPTDVDTPFPCRGGQCGCKSAFQCWTNCCCHSAKKRLDWAAKHGIAVPEYGQHLKALAAKENAKSQARKAACCQAAQVSVSSPKAACCAGKPRPAEGTAKVRLKVILSILALGCRGSSGELANLPWAIVAVLASGSWSFEPLVFALALFNVRGPDHFYPPELPPPRLS